MLQKYGVRVFTGWNLVRMGSNGVVSETGNYGFRFSSEFRDKTIIIIFFRETLCTIAFVSEDCDV